MSDTKTTGKHTLVEEGTEFKGTLSSKCPIVVVGKVEGEVSGPSIHIAASGVVAGTVKVKELRSEGELAGDVEADAVKISGRVRDQTVIKAKTLEVSIQSSGTQVVFGDCELAVGEAPNKDAAIAAATAGPDAKQAPAPARAPTGNVPKTKAEPEAEPKRGKTGTLPPPT